MKQKILDGSFTPNITNSWANSKTFITIDGCDYFFRSSWESIFWLKTSFYFEKIRIPYINSNGENKIYIVDFVDFDSKKLIEIKPSSEKCKMNNILKENSAKKWASKNNFNYEIIDEFWFIENLTDADYINFKSYNTKIDNGLKTFLKLKRKYLENKEN